MNNKDLEIAFTLIDENGTGDFEGEKKLELIKKAEHELSLAFPSSYKQFLSKLGCGDIEGLEFYGIIDEDFKNSAIPNAVWLTLEERKNGLPQYLIIVYSLGDGSFYAIDTRETNKEGENPIVHYSIDGKIKKVKENYGSFFLHELMTVLY